MADSKGNWDHPSDLGNWLKNAPGAIWEWGKKRPTAPTMDQNPYLSNYGSLISQLEAQASGQGPSLAGNAYKQAAAQGMRQQQAMASGGSAGAARQAGMNMGRISQGLGQGYANARLQEQMAARSALTQALQGASNAWFQPQYANQQAQLQTPNNMSMLTGLGGGILAGFAKAFGG